MKHLLIICAVAITVSACGTRQSATIDGEVSHADGKKVYLYTCEKGDFDVRDSVVIKDGKFSFGRTAFTPDQGAVKFEGVDEYVPFLLEEGIIVVKGDIDSPGQFVVSGTTSNELLTQYEKEQTIFHKEMSALNRKWVDAADTLKEGISEEMKAAFKKMDLKKIETLKKNNQTLFAAYLLSDEFNITGYEQLDSLMNLLDPNLNNGFVERLKEKLDILQKVTVGSVAPDFSIPSLQGGFITLSSLRGKYVMIDFWASWCEPCREENPRLVELFNQYKDEGFTILGVSIDNDKEKWTRAIKDDGLAWNHGSNLVGWDVTAKTYGVNRVPHTVLLDRQGKIIATGLRGEALSTKLKEIFPEPIGTTD